MAVGTTWAAFSIITSSESPGLMAMVLAKSIDCLFWAPKLSVAAMPKHISSETVLINAYFLINFLYKYISIGVGSAALALGFDLDVERYARLECFLG